MTYRVVQRNMNSWRETASGNAYEIVDQCGHWHRTLAGAIRCKHKLGDSFLGRLGRVENALGESAQSVNENSYATAEQEAFER